MFFHIFALSLCSSIDSIGIGISYGIRNIKIEKASKIILFMLSLIISSFSILLGNFLFSLFSDIISKLISISILIVMGIYIIISSFKTNSTSFDKNNSKTIEWKESIALGVTLSIDSICVGISATALISNYILFPLFISVFQIVFLTVGTILGKYLANVSKIPDNIWSILSGILLILIGILKFN